MRAIASAIALLVGCGSAEPAPVASPEPVACDAPNAPGGAELARGVAAVQQDPASATPSFAQSCELGNACGCGWLGTAYDNGWAVSEDPARARELYGRACDGGDQTGCHNLGALLRDGRGGEVDAARAITLFERACEGGVANGCTALGLALESANGADERIDALFVRGCDGGDPWGCNNEANRAARRATDDAALSQAMALYERACEGGVAASCVAIGRAYVSGQGYEENAARGVEYYRRACEAEVAWGCAFLGEAYAMGIGVGSDPALAREKLSWACERDNGVACTSLALVESDGSAANALFERGCALGAPGACDRAARDANAPVPDLDALDLAAEAPALDLTREDAGELDVSAGGEVDVATAGLRPACTGRVDRAPDAAIVLPRRGRTRLELRARSFVDTTLVVRAPDGSFHCADDGFAGNYHPRVEPPVAGGRYLVWVGTFGAAAPAKLSARAW